MEGVSFFFCPESKFLIENLQIFRMHAGIFVYFVPFSVHMDDRAPRGGEGKLRSIAALIVKAFLS